jgi:hypothetical protein
MLLLALQFWDGDANLVDRLARFIADNEPEKRSDVGIIFCPRFDARVNTDVFTHMKQKFEHVETHVCRRRGAIGHPYACNEMAHDLFMLFHGRCLRDKDYLKKVDGVYLMEGDLVPMTRDWLDQIILEWEEARADNKLILGAWQPEHTPPVGHINGNLIFSPDLALKIAGMEGCAPHQGWDVVHAPKLVPVAKKSRQMLNLYKATGTTEKSVRGWTMVHGVKDDSAWNIAMKNCGKL